MHPNAEGYKLLAGLIWDAMVANDIDPATGVINGSGDGSRDEDNAGNGGCGRSF